MFIEHGQVPRKRKLRFFIEKFQFNEQQLETLTVKPDPKAQNKHYFKLNNKK